MATEPRMVGLQGGIIEIQWGQIRLILNCSDFLSSPFDAGSTGLFNFSGYSA